MNWEWQNVMIFHILLLNDLILKSMWKDVRMETWEHGVLIICYLRESKSKWWSIWKYANMKIQKIHESLNDVVYESMVIDVIFESGQVYMNTWKGWCEIFVSYLHLADYYI